MTKPAFSQTQTPSPSPFPTPTPSPTPTPTPVSTETPLSTATPTPSPMPSIPIPTPSVPEFTLKFVDNSYKVPPTKTSTTNPYTGKTTTTTIPGYSVENLTIEVTIKNQPFPSTLNGNISNLYYNVETKGHFGYGWTEWYTYSYSSPGSLQSQSNSEYTVLSFPANYQSGYEIDFQVEAILGYQYTYTYFIGVDIPVHASSFAYQSSDWSPTQTITIPAYTVPEFSTWIILPLFAVLMLLSTVFIRRRIPKKNITFFV